jgi:hypothetical protein
MLGINNFITATAEKAWNISQKDLAANVKKSRPHGKKAGAHKEESTVNDAGTRLYQGNIFLRLSPVLSFAEVSKFSRLLSSLDNVKVVSSNWSEDEGFVIIVSLKSPLALLPVLASMPEIAEVRPEAKTHKEPGIILVLKTLE